MAEERRRTDLARAAEGGVWEEVGPDETAAPAQQDATSSAILEAEPEVGPGLAGALKLAMNKGYVDQEESGKKVRAGGVWAVWMLEPGGLLGVAIATWA